MTKIKKIVNNLKSICCNANVRIEGMDDFDKQGTMYHVCTTCNQPCDVIFKIRKGWEINPVTRIIPNKKKIKSTKLTAKEIKEIKKQEDF
jgi:hypothetical protein